MLPTELVAGLCTWENAGVLSRLYVIALSMAQITNTNRTACKTCSKFVFQALNLHSGRRTLCRRILDLTSESAPAKQLDRVCRSPEFDVLLSKTN